MNDDRCIVSYTGKSRMARLTVTDAGEIRIKVPDGYDGEKLKALKEVATMVVSDRFGVTMRGHTMVRDKMPIARETITMYNDCRSLKKTYTLTDMENEHEVFP